MKLTYKKDKSFDFESNYVEIHVTVYTIPHNENITSLYKCVYTEFDVSLFELMDSNLSIDNYTLNKFPDLKSMYPYNILITVTDIKLYNCDLTFESMMKSLIKQYKYDGIVLKKDDLLFDLSYEQKDGVMDIKVTFFNCLFDIEYAIECDIDHGNFIHLTPEWVNIVYY